MGKLVQRRAFDHVDFAEMAAVAFHEPTFAIPGLKVSTGVVEQDGQVWLLLTQEGSMVIGPEPILPDYEFVAFQP